MVRPKNIVPTRALTIRVPEPLAHRLELFLMSSLEGRVPLGDYQRWMVARIGEFFEEEAWDVPDAGIVRGRPEVLQRLKEVLGYE